MNSVRNYPAPRNAKPPGPVTRKMLHERTCEIARLAGRTAPYVTQDDYEQAKRELTGDPHAVIMDTSIDQGVLYPTGPTRAEAIIPGESNPAGNPHSPGGPPASRVFFGSFNSLRDCPPSDAPGACPACG